MPVSTAMRTGCIVQLGAGHEGGERRMIRSLRTFGLGLVVAIAAGAVPTSAASAEDFFFRADGDYVTLTALQAGVFTTDAGAITCNEIRHIGEVDGVAATAATTLELVATFTECSAGGFPADVAMNGCTYILNAGTKIVTGNPSVTHYEGSTAIECPPGKEISMTVTVFGVPKCTIHTPAQGPLGTVTYRNSEGKEYFNAESNIGGIKYSQTAGSGIGSCATVSGTENGTYEGETTVAGDNESEGPTSIWIE